MKKTVLFAVAVLALFLLTCSAFGAEYLDYQKSSIGTWYDCEDAFQLKIFYQPIMTKSQSYQIAQGMFILVRVQIMNTTGKTIDGLRERSFTLYREFNGKFYGFPLSTENNIITSKIWDLNNIYKKMPNMGMMDTYLVFDVEGKYNDNWVLSFKPVEDGTGTQLCTLNLKLPKISYTP